MSDHNQNDEPPNIHYEGGVPVFGLSRQLNEVDRRQAESERRESQYQGDQIVLNKWLVGSTIALVFCTLTLGGVEACYMHRQWKLNADALSKMGDQIWAAKDAAQASKTASETAAKTLGQMQAQTTAQQDAVRMASKNFQQDQRPYISVTDLKPGTLVFKIGTPASWSIQFINYGRSPAIHLHAVADIFVGKDTVKQMEAFFFRLSKERSGHHSGAPMLVPPLVGNGCPDSPSCKYTTIVSKFVLTADDATFFKTYDAGVIIAGRIWYRDSFGNPYTSDFCEFTLITGAVAGCPEHN